MERLVEQFRSNKVEIALPKFSDNGLTNPQQFLHELERYCRLRDVPPESKLKIVETCLAGRALNWFTIHRDDFRNFQHFVNKFEAEFYSIPVRIRIKTRWQERRYKLSDGSILAYFYDQVRAAQYLCPRLGVYEMHYTIVQQLPMRVREILATVDYADTTILIQALEQLDKSREIENERYKSINNKDSNNDKTRRQVNTMGVIEAGQSQSSYHHDDNSKRSWTGRYNRGYSKKRNEPYNRKENNRDLVLPDMRFPPPNHGESKGINQFNTHNSENC
ncbi:uncharacterized protein LOC112495254 [Cephus cinctus]|uniref:Uncharacterized protein LOC112495254 n=1 Tax=Cephus cinctus TaxID=211228 RepID=A0AAJ7RTF2_CEPCN|nr:uncharacterized protein LOC112495254 [Cephus cinctus]